MRRAGWVAALLASFALTADAQVVRLRSGGGAFLGGDVSGQSNFCGPDATTNVEIGSCSNDANAGTGGTSVVIGNGASNSVNSTGVVMIGSLAVASNVVTDGVAIGRASDIRGTNTVALGAGARATGNNSLAIGPNTFATASSLTLGVAAGGGSVPANAAVFGSATLPYSTVYFGEGFNDTTALAYTISGTQGTGADNAGGALNLLGGPSTGSATPGVINLQTTTAAGSSSTVQTAATRLTIGPTAITSTLPLALPDGSASDNPLRFASTGATTGWRAVSGDWMFERSGTDSLRLGPSATTVAGQLGVGATVGVATTFVRGNSIDGSIVKTLTETTATEFVRVAVPQTAGSNFAGGTAIWTAYASDGTDSQAIHGESKFAAVNKAGTETCAAIIDSQTLAAASAGTLTCAITCVTGLTDLIGLAANCTSSLTQTTLSFSWRLDMPKTQTATAQ